MKLVINGISYSVDVRDGEVAIDGTAYKVKREGSGPIVTVMVDAKPYKIDLSAAGDINGELVQAIVDGEPFQVTVQGGSRPHRRRAPVAQSTKRPPTGGVKAVMPGKITAVRCREGDTVAIGDVLCILEAMKMENEVRSPIAGVVKTVPVTAGSNVDKGDILAVVE